ncbi:Sulfatase [anaerobic digester metagenome]
MLESNPNNKENKLLLFLKKYRLWIFLIAAAVFITGVVFLITSNHLYLLFINFLHNPALFILNILPVFLLIVLVYFISGRAVFSATLGAAVFTLLSFVDKIKITMRQEPLLPSDLTLAKEVWAIVKNFPRLQLILVGLSFMALIVLLASAFYLSKGKKPLWKMRILGFLVFLVIGYGANALLYTNVAIYDRYPVMGNPYFQVNQYNSKGLIYSFCHQFNITRITTPQGYNKAFFDELERSETVTQANNKPHIVMIMGEAFSDLSDNPNLDFSNYQDPLVNFKEMANSKNAVSGKIVVPGFGGGTSNTEYDVLTACPTRLLNNPLPSYNFIRQPFDALPRRLAQIGYETQAIHPGYQWFYNRKNVYPNLGFENNYFLETSFDLATQGIGGYISDKAAMDRILENLDTHIKTKDTPLFSFTVTIQNHGPYDGHYGTLPKSFDTDIPLTDTQKDLLTQYFKGIHEADQELGRLRDYAQESSEPIVIVYFGDHLPGFSNGMEFFDLLDYPIDPNGTLKERLALYETPFLIWQNDAAKKQCPFSNTADRAKLPESGVINSNYLGALLTQLLDMKGVSPLFDYANDARQVLPAGTNNIFVDSKGGYTDIATEEQLDVIHRLRDWQYYKLFDQTAQK